MQVMQEIMQDHADILVSTRSHCFFHRTTKWTLNSQVSGVAIRLRLRYSQSLKPCKLQKPIPNHQSSFCWICLPLLILLTLPSSTVKPQIKMIQNAVARLVFNEPKRAHVTPLFVSLHWLPVAACIQFKTLMLAYRTTTGSAPSYFHSL